MDAEQVDTQGLSKGLRLEIIRELLLEVVPGIRTVQDALQGSEETSVSYMAVAALGRLGWIAEQGCVIAGYEFAPVVGSADAWLLGPANVLSKLRTTGGGRPLG